jgi:hypothetical protein
MVLKLKINLQEKFNWKEITKKGKIYLNRFEETLIGSWHNHLRINRILAHMNVVGFRKYAI